MECDFQGQLFSRGQTECPIQVLSTVENALIFPANPQNYQRCKKSGPISVSACSKPETKMNGSKKINITQIKAGRAVRVRRGVGKRETIGQGQIIHYRISGTERPTDKSGLQSRVHVATRRKTEGMLQEENEYNERD